MLLVIFFVIGISFLIFGFVSSFSNESIDDLLSSQRENRKLFLLSVVFFLLFFNISLLLFSNRTEPYVRPHSYFFTLSLTVVPLVGQIFYTPQKNFYRLLIFGQIIVVSFSFILTLNSLYPTLLGADPWGHRIFSEEIISLGFIEQDGGYETKYKLQPIFHLNTASFSIISDTSYKISSLFSIGLTSFILILFGIYITIKEIFYPKLALMTALIVGFSNTIIRRVGMGIIPNTLGIAIGILVLGLLVKKEKDRVIIGLIFFLALIINLTHSFSYMIFVLQTSIIAIAAFIFRRKTFKSYLRIALGVFILGMVYWYWVARSFGHGLIRHFRFIIEGYEAEYVAAEGTGVGVSTTTMILGRSGIILFFTISILGLIWIFVSERKFKQYSILGIGGIAYSLSVFAIAAGGLVGISSRFWYYMMIVCGIAVVFGIFLFLSLTKNFTIKKIGVVIIVFGLTLVMFTSPHANVDNPHVGFHGSTRNALKESEVSGAEFAVENISEEDRIYSDSYYRGRIGYYHKYNIGYPHNRSLSVLNSPIVNRTAFLESPGYIVLRSEMYEHGVSWRAGFQRVSEEDKIELDGTRNKIYENNEVVIYSKPETQ